MADGWGVVPEGAISEDEAQGALNLATQGTAQVTSGFRTQEHNAAVHGVPNSLHLAGQAADFVLPPGSDPHAVRSELESQGYPVTEWLIEKAGDAHSTGPHIHWGWGPKAGGAAIDPWAVTGAKAAPPSNDPWAVTQAAPAQAPQQPAQPMPNPLTALVQGIISSGKDVAQTFTGKRQADSGGAASEPLHWADVLHPMDALAKVAYGFGASAPMLAGGVAGAVAGGAIPVAGETGIPEVAGGALGATLGTTIQTLGPMYAAELQRTPKDPDGAFNRAVKRAGLESAASGASWAAFGYAPFRNQVKNLLLQAFAVQPGISMGAKALSNAQQGKPVGEGMDETYLQGAAGTIVPAAGHALASIALSRMGLHTQAALAADKAQETSRKEPVAEAPKVQPARPDLLEMAAIPKPGRKEPTAAPAQERPAEATPQPAEAATGQQAPEVPKEQPAEEPPQAPIERDLQAEHEAWRAQVDRSEPVMESVLPRKRVNWHGVPTGDLNIVRDPQTGLFGLRHGSFVGDGGMATPYSFQYASPQQALDAAKEAFLDQANRTLDDRRTSVSAKREANALKNWAEKLAVPTPPPEGPPDQGPPGQVYTPEVQPAVARPDPAQGIQDFLAAPEQKQTVAGNWKEAGKSTDGRTLFEDKNGVRSYVENGVRVTEPVQLRPTRGGMELAVDRGAHPEFATPEESQALPPSLPAPVAEPAPPSHPRAIELANVVAEHLKTGKPLTAKDLQAMAEGVYGGTLASGTVPRDDLYDAAELGINLFLRQFPSAGGHGPFSPAVDDGNATSRAGYLEALKNRLPTQTVRAGEKETHQQFSTPTDYAYAGAWAANLHPSDVVLEPSAGTGSFVTHALNAGVREVHANDLSDRRTDMLRALDPTNVTQENAEHIDALLPENLKPTVVLMNPPFSQTAGRMGNKRVLGVDFQHVKAALRKLAPGGRLVAILGGGAKPGNHGWRGIRQENDIRANIGVEGAIYRKYGTTFPTRLVVIDKRAPSGVPALEVEGLKSAQDIIRALKDVRDDRLHLAGEQPSAEPAGETLAGRGESAIEPGAPVPEPAGAVGGREGRPSAQPGGTTGPRAAGERPPRNTGKRGQGAGSRVPLAGEQPERSEPRGAGEHPGTGAAASEEPVGSGGGGAGDGIRPDGSGQRTEPGVTEAPAVVRATEASLAADPETAPISDAVYETYKPQRVAVEGAKPHPGPLVQSAAMASVLPPRPDHVLSIPKRIIEQGALSDAQIEAVVYAGYAHAKMIPESGIPDTLAHLPERRRGFFIGDGTGVGKGREVAGIMLDNWHAGRRQHIWVSEKRPLINDAMRDLKGVTLDPKHIIDHGAVKAGDTIKKKEGVLFTTYDTLKSAEQIKKETTDESGKKVLAKAKGKTRVQQIIDWVGPDFDGVIAFDEAHNLGNSFDMKGNRGMKKAAAKALAGVELAKRLPKARVVYVSATGATEVENLGYADRLGLWGKDTAFANRDDFMAKVKKGGVAAMELVARDMKALGRYIARSLSYDGVEYDRVEHTLTPQQRDIYDNLADAWQLVLRNFNAAMEKAGITEKGEDGSSKTKSAQAKSAILAQFWGGNQRFFNQVLTAMQMPTVLRNVEKDLAEGRQAVLQLVNTNEAAQTRALDKVRAEGDESDLEDLDMSPKSQLLQLVSNAYPVGRFEEYMDENGNVRSRPAMDSKGNVIQDPALVAAREALLDQLGAIRVPDGPLEMLLNHFGTEKVAEVTGRKERVVRKPDEKTGEMRTVVEKRPGSSNVVEADLFQEAKKPILVFSEAGGTGRSYHADVNAASADKRRSHYLVQAGWRADKAVQGFGRTHRTNQASAPIFHLVTTDLQGQKRFVSSIARRLGQLGALTKGERRTGNQGMFGLRDNLESEEAKLALKTFYSDAIADRIPGVGLQMLEEQMGLKLVEESTGRQLEELPPITQFLNRVLSLRTGLQNMVFDEFSKRLDDAIDRAAAAGTLDTGVETRRADKIIKRGDQVVYTDPESGAETHHVHLETHDKVTPAKFADVVTRLRKHNADGVTPFVRSVKSGKVFGVQDATPFTDKNGAIIEQKRLVGPLSYEFIPTGNLNSDRYWQPIDKPDQQAAAWEAQLAKLPEYAKADLHLITGAVLPIWDRLQGSPRIFRLQTDDGEKMLGRVIPNDSVAATLKALGAEALKVRESPAEIATSILEDGKRATLANGWEIKRSMVAGEPRIEIVGPDHAFLNELKGEGVFTERIDWQTRFFIPTGERAGDIIAAITKKRPVTQLAGKAQASQHQTAYHGSPYDFDRFQNEAIGSGEGAAAYGHGHYFAGARAVAEYYKEQLSGRQGPSYTLPDGRTLNHEAAAKWLQQNFDLPTTYAARTILRDLGAGVTMKGAIEAAPASEDVVRWAYKNLKAHQAPKGKLYTVKLAPKEHEWLDWDKPMGQQSPHVIEALKKASLFKDEATPPKWEESPDGNIRYMGTNGGRHFTLAYLKPNPRIGGYDIHHPHGPNGWSRADHGYRGHSPSLERAKEWIEKETPDTAWKIGDHGIPGSIFYRTLMERLAPPEEPPSWTRAYTGYEGQPNASEALRKLGIPGIRYADANSRLAVARAEAKLADLERQPKSAERDAAIEAAKKDLASHTFNYVVFDPEHISIESKERREALAARERLVRTTRLSHDIVAELPHAPSPEEQTVIDRVTRIAKSLAPKAEVVAARNLYAEGELGHRREHGISGATTRGVRRLIAWSLASPDAIATVRHEAIHWLRANGFFKAAEWAGLEKAARTGDWIGRYNIRERYPDLPFESQIEEAIAEHFAYWRRGLRGIPELVRPMFERLAAMIGRVRDYLHEQFGHDVTAENIFHRIQSGEIGSRSSLVEHYKDVAFIAPKRPFGRAGLQEMDASLFQKMEPEERDGRIVEAARALVNVAEDFQMLTAPMARGTDTARATVKDFLNLIRAGRDYGQFRIKQLGKEFSHAELKRMWEAADAESILRQKGVGDTEGRGLSTLSERERAAVDRDQADADSVWNAMIKAGQVKAEGLPSYVPHLYVEVGETGYRRLGGNRNVRSIPGMGKNVQTSSPHMKHRKYLTAEEGAEAAAKKFGVETAVLKDIRTLPLATSRNRQALAGYQLIKTIREMGRAVGEDWVAEGATPPGFFHIDNPAFFRWQPKLVRNEESGKLEPAADQNGNKQWERIPLSVHEAWEGPLRAGLTQESSAAYRAFMDLKMRAMTNIMFSPLVQLHFMTELGRAFPAAPGKIITTKLFMEGFQAKQDPATRLRAVMAGLVPVGRHGALQDISSVTETQSLRPGRSWTSQILAAVPGLFDPRAGQAVKRGVDAIGNLLHGTLLWDRVEDLQFGLFLTLSDWARGKGLSPESADRLAAHQANRFAGTLPQESMSSFARKLSNVMLFSRTYTLGNLGMFKDALGSLAGAGVNLVGRGIGRPDIGKNWGGLPRDVQAQIGRDAPEELARVQSLAKRKALGMLAIDVALIYGLSAAAQNFFQYMQGEGADDIVKGYAARWTKLEADIRKDPFLIANPFYALMHLSPLWENELDPNTGMPLQRIFIGYDKEGTAVYARNPLGKYAEEITNWTSAPLETLKSKLNALGVKPTMDVLHNDRGFGRKIWLPSDNIAQMMGKIAAHYAEAVIPMNQVQATYDMLTGHTRSLDAERLVGGAAGITFRHGAPGGPAVGLMYQVRDVHEAKVRDQMPGIMQQIKEGDLQGARVKMNALHIPPRLQSWYIRVARNPRLRLSGRALRDFMREATPEQRAQMERMRGANQ